MQEAIDPSSRPADLSFETTLVIVGGGAVDIALLQRLHAAGAAVVAADGGAETCLRGGIMPQAIIGDMDSLGDIAGWAKKTRIIEIAEQESTDFEKCLQATAAPVTLALGMTGKRLDHTLAALDALARHAADRWVIMVDEEDIALAVCGGFAFEVVPGTRVSVHPLQQVRFAGSTGLQYPLDGLVLAPGVRTGTSNTAETGPFSIETGPGETGAWLLIVGREHLDPLIGRLNGLAMDVTG